MVSRFERFSLSIFEISRCWHKIAGEEMAKYGLKGPHSIYLMILRHHSDGLTAAQLCEHCGRDKADVSRGISLMEKQGLVKREGDNAYRAKLSLTQAGMDAAEHIAGRASVAVELAGRDLTEKDREVFYASLSSITEKLRQLSRNGLPE